MMERNTWPLNIDSVKGKKTFSHVINVRHNQHMCGEILRDMRLYKGSLNDEAGKKQLAVARLASCHPETSDGTYRMCGVRSNAMLHQERRSTGEKEDKEADSWKVFTNLRPSLRKSCSSFANNLIVREIEHKDRQEERKEEEMFESLRVSLSIGVPHPSRDRVLKRHLTSSMVASLETLELMTTAHCGVVIPVLTIEIVSWIARAATIRIVGSLVNE